MAFDLLKEEVCEANLEIVKAGLVELTWGNVSGADRDAGVMAIKPSGISYSTLKPDDIVVLSLESGEILDGHLKPSSDAPTHLVLYQRFDGVAGIVHTHSSFAVSWSQAEREIPCLGTTHADHFNGPVPVTRRMKPAEIKENYEHNTGLVIVERFQISNLDPLQIPAALVACHGPFAWGPTLLKAVENAIVLESVARMASQTFAVNTEASNIDSDLLDKHYRRKHGKNAYYGQD